MPDYRWNRVDPGVWECEAIGVGIYRQGDRYMVHGGYLTEWKFTSLDAAQRLAEIAYEWHKMKQETKADE